MSAPRVHLFDAHVYIFRAWFSLPPMEAPDGTPTQAAYGFANTLIRYLTEERPSHVACCFDHTMTSFRNRRFPAYKASRLEAPPELEPQFALCVEVARALGLSTFSVPDFEADDLLGTLAQGMLADGARVRVISADKDLAQLVTEDGRVELYDLARDRALDADAVRQKFGVPPARIPDYLGLVGDSVDELPGVPGIGPKTAAAAVSGFGPLESFPSDLGPWQALGIRGARRAAERFASHREQALQVRDLATVVREVPGLETGIDHLVWEGPDLAAAEALCERLGWGRIATRIQEVGEST